MRFPSRHRTATPQNFYTIGSGGGLTVTHAKLTTMNAPCPLMPCSRLLLAAFTACLCGALSACVDTTAGRPITALQYCQEKAGAECRKYWQCLTEPERNQKASELAMQGYSLGANEKDCREKLAAPCQTKPFSCEINAVFQEQTAGSCIDALMVLECGQLLRAQAAAAPQCERVCTPRI